MRVEFLVDEESKEAALRNILPKIAGDLITYQIHVLRGKSHILPRLRAYKKWLPKDRRILVLFDNDKKDCEKVKAELEQFARTAGLPTKTAPGHGKDYQVVNRLAIEELESWFFGDIEALVKAYPGVPDTLAEKSGFRDPDAIQGGTWEQLEKILQKAGHYSAGLAKITAARDISSYMDPERNRSKSFQVFRDTIKMLAKIS
jgi:hypothetical protein